MTACSSTDAAGHSPGPRTTPRGIAAALVHATCLVAASGLGGFAAARGESVARDPRTRAEVIWVVRDIPPGAEDHSLAAASWSGPVVDGKAHGRGTLTVAVRERGESGERRGEAQAEMSAGRLHGEVSLKWADGSSFVGRYAKGMRAGPGRLTRADGMIIEGEWADDRLRGRCTITHPDGTVYAGDVVDTSTGRRLDGSATIRYPNGAVYEGEVRAGRPYGAGVLRDHRGVVVSEGPWGARREGDEEF